MGRFVAAAPFGWIQEDENNHYLQQSVPSICQRSYRVYLDALHANGQCPDFVLINFTTARRGVANGQPVDDNIKYTLDELRLVFSRHKVLGLNTACLRFIDETAEQFVELIIEKHRKDRMCAFTIDGPHKKWFKPEHFQVFEEIDFLIDDDEEDEDDD